MTPAARLVVGSRRSVLARIQAEGVGARLREAWPGVRVEHAFLTTGGDRVLDQPLPEIGGKGLFTAELEAALRSGEIDVAVHSLKDLPTEESPGLALLAVPEREDPRDVLVIRAGGRGAESAGAAAGAEKADALQRKGGTAGRKGVEAPGVEGPGLEDLPPGSVVGTSSLRRRALLLRRRPDCEVRSIRGNVETRLEKLARGDYDALLLAAAGLARLGRLDDVEGRALDPPGWLSAPGQGALAVQGRTDDPGIGRLVAAIDDGDARAAVEAERALLAALEGGCQVPIGAHARMEGSELVLRAIVLAPDGSEALEGSRRGSPRNPRGLGRGLGEEFRARGVERLLALAERR